ncbi:MAG: DUF1800 family protein [Verrucomicrobiota bacterium]
MASTSASIFRILGPAVFVLLLLVRPVSAGIDKNGNLISDVWEVFFKAYHLLPENDEDEDGLTNAEESVAGTDPFRPDSRPALQFAENGQQVQWTGKVGKVYEVESATELGPEASWMPLSEVLAGADETLTWTLPEDFYEQPTRFVRLIVTDPDTDGDGATDWEERTLGYDPEDPESKTPGVPDGESMAELLTVLAPGEELLFLAEYGPELSAPTQGSGFTTLLLSPDRTTGTIASTFSNLTSPQTAAHVHVGTSDVRGPVAEGIPLGLFSDYVWQFDCPPNTNQLCGFPPGDYTPIEILQALHEGRLYANVHSVNHPDGEIRGHYRQVVGSIEFSPPPDAGLPQDPGSPDTTITDAARLLTQATFGPTEEGIDQVAEFGTRAWIERQMDPTLTPVSKHLDYVRASDAEYWDLIGSPPGDISNGQPLHTARRTAWWTLAVNAPDQLRQRMAFALSEIFVISENQNEIRTRHEAAAQFYDIFVNEAFGNFRDLLEQVSLHPMMGVYLSMLQNQKADDVLGTQPDENYAREIMQLFTVGLLELHPDGSYRLDPDGQAIPTYDQTDITELARVFTGWAFAERHDDRENVRFNYGGGPRYFQKAWLNPMKMFPEEHDGGAKTLIGDIAIPEGLSGEADMDRALDTLFNHPNVGPFICRILIQRLVTSNPSPGYLYRVVQAFNDNGAGVRGDLGSVVEQILLDQEARNPTFHEAESFGKQREPMVRLTHLIRALGGATEHPVSTLVNDYGYPAAGFPADASRYRLNLTTNLLGQSPLAAPSVFNWFQPDYRPPGLLADTQLLAPEFELTTDTLVLQNANLAQAIFINTNGIGGSNLPAPYDTRSDNTRFTLSHLVPLSDSDLVDHLSKTLLTDRMSDDLRTTLHEMLADIPSAARERSAAYLIATSPEFIIQK